MDLRDVFLLVLFMFAVFAGAAYFAIFAAHSPGWGFLIQFAIIAVAARFMKPRPETLYSWFKRVLNGLVGVSFILAVFGVGRLTVPPVLSPIEYLFRYLMGYKGII